MVITLIIVPVGEEVGVVEVEEVGLGHPCFVEPTLAVLLKI